MHPYALHYNIYEHVFLSYKQQNFIYKRSTAAITPFDLKNGCLVYQKAAYIYLLFFKIIRSLLLSQ